MCDRGGAAAPADAGEALAMAHAALDFLNQADLADLGTETQAAVLVELEKLAAKQAAAQARILPVFSSSGGPRADGQYSAATWLRHFTKVTRHAAGVTVAAARRLACHPAVAGALAGGGLSVSWARQICDWTDRLPGEHRDAAERILVAAAQRGADLETLAQIAAEIYLRVAGPDGDGDLTGDRYVCLGVTFGGAGLLEGSLTPDATAAVSAVLAALSTKAGPEDTRSRGQRQHDALAEACQRLLAANLVPGWAGGDTRAEVVIGLRQLRALPGAAAVEDDWIAETAAAASGQPEAAEPGAASVLSGPAATATTCHASLVPVVTGQIDPEALGRLTAVVRGVLAAGPNQVAVARERLTPVLLRWAIDVVSGPAGLASRLRTGLLDGPLANPSLPLDVGVAGAVVPGHLRRALARRDRHCQFPGCRRPASVCHPHHITPRARGGPTTLDNLGLFCTFHHLIVIHTWGWQVTRYPDGTIVATSPEGQTLRSPPPAA